MVEENKSIEFTQSQIKAYENGNSMFIVPITDVMLRMSQCGNSTIMDFAPIRKGDKDIFIQEEFRLYTETQIDYKADTPNINLDWEDASKMTKEQSRYTISECIDVRAEMVKELEHYEYMTIFPKDDNYGIANDYKAYKEDFIEDYNNQLKEQNINRTYEDNDYVFLIEVKR